MSKLDELDLEFDEKFVEGMNYIANGNKLGTVEAIKSFARKYYELGKAEGYKAREMFPIDAFQAGKLEEREALKKKIEDLDYRGPAGFGYVSREEVLNALSTLNNEK